MVGLHGCEESRGANRNFVKRLKMREVMESERPFEDSEAKGVQCSRRKAARRIDVDHFRHIFCVPCSSAVIRITERRPPDPKKAQESPSPAAAALAPPCSIYVVYVRSTLSHGDQRFLSSSCPCAEPRPDPHVRVPVPLARIQLTAHSSQLSSLVRPFTQSQSFLAFVTSNPIPFFHLLLRFYC